MWQHGALNDPHYLSTVNGRGGGELGEGKRQTGKMRRWMDGVVKKKRRGCREGGDSYGDTSVSRKRKESLVVVVVVAAGLIRDGNEILNREEKIA